jgi:hypothetical protein
MKILASIISLILFMVAATNIYIICHFLPTELNNNTLFLISLTITLILYWNQITNYIGRFFKWFNSNIK